VAGSRAEPPLNLHGQTTFAIPESVVQNAIQKLKSQDFPDPQGGPAFRNLYRVEPNELTPILGMVNVIENNVTIEIPDLNHVNIGKIPLYISAQGQGKGSVEASGISSFLVTLNEFAAGAVAGSLQQGTTPLFTVHYNLKEMFYISDGQVVVTADVDKVFD
jgi:hypothetical protein